MKTYYGIKTGMTQAWTKSGLRLPVTIIKTDPMVVTQVKTAEKDGYAAIQIGIGSRQQSRVNKALKNHLSKAKVAPRSLKEVRENELSQSVGDQILVNDVIEVGDIVKVTGHSKGRGFSGGMKRWGFKGGPKTHGQSDRARAPGSIGQGTTPGRVYKGKHMAGRYGGETYAIRNLTVVKVDSDLNQVWVNGPIPGTAKDLVTIEIIKKGKFEGLREEETKSFKPNSDSSKE